MKNVHDKPFFFYIEFHIKNLFDPSLFLYKKSLGLFLTSALFFTACTAAPAPDVDGGDLPEDSAVNSAADLRAPVGGNPDMAMSFKKYGLLSVVQLNTLVGGVPDIEAVGTAYFFDLTGIDNSKCTTTTIGPCSSTQCTGTSQPTPYLSAGPVTLTGAAPETLTYAAGMYSGFRVSAIEWAEGAKVTVSAPGDAAPAFHVSVTMPARATVSAPVPPALGEMLTLSRTQDLAFTWDTHGNGDRLSLTLEGEGLTLSCIFPGAPGHGTVPAAALALFPPGAGAIGVYVQNETIVADGDWQITAYAAYAPVTPDGSYFTLSVVWQ